MKCPNCGSTDVEVSPKEEIGGPTDIMICDNCGEWSAYSGPPAALCNAENPANGEHCAYLPHEGSHSWESGRVQSI